MTDISTNKQIRRQQFRATAKEILERAKASWGSTNRIGQLATAMERAYAAIGSEGRDGGRGSRGNEVGTISLGRMAHLGADAVPPSSLVIDMADLQRRVLDQLVRAGVRDAVTL